MTVLVLYRQQSHRLNPPLPVLEQKAYCCGLLGFRRFSCVRIVKCGPNLVVVQRPPGQTTVVILVAIGWRTFWQKTGPVGPALGGRSPALRALHAGFPTTQGSEKLACNMSAFWHY